MSEPSDALRQSARRRLNGMRVLFFGAHPDDAEISAFGTLGAYVAEGAEITLAMATGGEGGKLPSDATMPLPELRLREAARGAALLSARLVPLGLVDGTLPSNRRKLLEQVGRCMGLCRADVVLTHSPTDYHPDHRVLSAAVGFVAAETAPVIYCDNMKGVHFTPTHYVDTREHHQRKLDGIRQHRSQNPRRYVLAADALARQRHAEVTGSTRGFMEALAYHGKPWRRVAQMFPEGTIAAGHRPAEG